MASLARREKEEGAIGRQQVCGAESFHHEAAPGVSRAAAQVVTEFVRRDAGERPAEDAAKADTDQLAGGSYAHFDLGEEPAVRWRMAASAEVSSSGGSRRRTMRIAPGAQGTNAAERPEASAMRPSSARKDWTVRSSTARAVLEAEVQGARCQHVAGEQGERS
jgi:hypothetical protein